MYRISHGKGKMKNGVTMVELVITISVVSIFSTFIFGSYLAIYKQFKYQTTRANKVIEVVRVKKDIDQIFKDIKEITGIYKNSFEYFDSKTNTAHYISLKNNSLYLDNTLIIDKIKSFTFSISEKKTISGDNLFIWEAVLINGYWIGGAKKVYYQ